MIPAISCAGHCNGKKIENELADKESLTSKVNRLIREQLKVRRSVQAFGRGNLNWAIVNVADAPEAGNQVLSYIRSYGKERVLVLNNLAGSKLTIDQIGGENLKGRDMFTGDEIQTPLPLEPFGFRWIKIDA